MRFPVIIPSAADDAGVASDYFQLGNINLLPMVHKTLIEYLVDDLQKEGIKDYIDAIHLVVASSQVPAYRGLFKDREKIVQITCQEPYEKRGILATVSGVANTLDRPFFIIYGDTLLHDDALKEMIGYAEEFSGLADSKPWAVVALIDPSETPPGLGQSHARVPGAASVLEKNRWGYVIADRERITGHSGKQYPTIDETCILDVVYRPSYVSLMPFAPGDLPLIESGAMILSPSFWQMLNRHDRRDPWGLHSITNSARRLLSSGEEFAVKGVIVRPDDWLDVNYPWEYLAANDYLTQRIRYHHGAATGNPDLDPGRYAVATSTEELIELFAMSKNKEVVRLPRRRDTPPELVRGFSSENDAHEWGIWSDAVIDGCLILPNPAHHEVKLFLGSGSVLRGNCVIRSGCQIGSGAEVTSSILGKDIVIDALSVVDHSVIMDGSKILYGAVVPYSIVGRGVVIAGNAAIAYERLDRSGQPRPSKYYASSDVVKHFSRFGSVVGDGVRVGMNAYVEPGRKIGRDSVIHPGVEVVHNCSPNSEVRTRNISDPIP